MAPERAAEILSRLPPFFQSVAVVVDPAPGEIGKVERIAPFGVWQLHGNESAASLAALSPRRLVKALHLPWKGTPEELAALGCAASAFLLDTPCAEYGGSGKTFDWDLVDAFRARADRPLILSGGLTPDNVAEAVRRVRPYGIDVSSGVERAPGIKDHEKLRSFIDRCRQAQP